MGKVDFKSRNLSGLKYEDLKAQLVTDAKEALMKYGERLDIRRGSLQRFFGEAGEVHVSKVRLIYEGGDLKPKDVGALRAGVKAVQEVIPGVEVVFQ